ncbi:MAG: hypothetical protein R2911_04520 [Caldilineaceae bacterium]
MSARIMQARIDIGEQRALLEAIEQKNSEIVWRINQASALPNVKQRAVALGYVDMPEHQYIGAAQVDQALLPGSPVAASLGLVNTSAAAALASNSSLSANDTQPLLVSSASNTVASGLNRTDSDPQLLNTSTLAEAASSSPVGLENAKRGWRQWIPGWLPFP